jgi:hypothetical protein
MLAGVEKYVKGAENMTTFEISQKLREVQDEYRAKYASWCKQFEGLPRRELAKIMRNYIESDDYKAEMELDKLIRDYDTLLLEEHDAFMAEHDAWSAKFEAIVKGMEAFNKAYESSHLK